MLKVADAADSQYGILDFMILWQTRSGQRTTTYMLEVEDADEDSSLLRFDLTAVYRANYINTCLGLAEQFKEHYFSNRKLQLNTELQFPTGHVRVVEACEIINNYVLFLISSK